MFCWETSGPTWHSCGCHLTCTTQTNAIVDNVYNLLHFPVTVHFTLRPYFLFFSLACCCHHILFQHNSNVYFMDANSLFSFIMVKCLVKQGLQFTPLLTALQTLELQEAICQSLMAFCHTLETVLFTSLCKKVAIDAYVAVATPHQSSLLLVLAFKTDRSVPWWRQGRGFVICQQGLKLHFCTLSALEIFW